MTHESTMNNHDIHRLLSTATIENMKPTLHKWHPVKVAVYFQSHPLHSIRLNTIDRIVYDLHNMIPIHGTDHPDKSYFL